MNQLVACLFLHIRILRIRILGALGMLGVLGTLGALGVLGVLGVHIWSDRSYASWKSDEHV